MKKIFIGILLLISSLASAKTYYVATNGRDTNIGTISQPWLTWDKGMTSANAGDTVYFRGGIYPATTLDGEGIWANGGTATQGVYYFAYPGEIPILDGANITNPSLGVNFGIRAWGVQNVHFKGLTIRNFHERFTDVITQGITAEDIGNSSFENMVFHDIDGIGLGIYDYYGTILVKNCDAYNVCDYLAWWPGQNGVAFQCNNYAHLYGTRVYDSKMIYEGCRAWGFSDNGFAGGGGGYIEYKNCWAFDGGLLNGEGCGFKLRASIRTDQEVIIPIQRKLTNCIGALNGHYAFSDNNRGYTRQNSQYFNCVAYHNGYKDCGPADIGPMGWGWMNYNFYGDVNGPNWLTANSISYDNEQHALNADNGENYYFVAEDQSVEWPESHNNWNNPPNISLSNSDFVSLDWREMLRPRKADGSLPDIDFMKPVSTSKLIDAGSTITGLPYSGSAPDIGWFEASSGSITPAIPAYLNSSIENATPARLEMNYSLTLANIVPATSAFTVRVNSVVRTVSSVTISGTKVLLTLSSPVVSGDIVTAAYTKPASNPLQTAAGGQAATLSAQNVTNNVTAAIPVYLSSVIENATPARLEMNYSLTLANIVPAASAFTVRVNSVVRTVSSVTISGTKVLLTLSSPIVFGDIVTVAYTKPASNPLQTAAGGQAATLSAQNVTNNVTAVMPVYVSSVVENATPARLEMNYSLTLANIVPAASAFTVRVNSVVRTVSSVTVSGTKVLLTLSSPIVFGDIVTVAYTKPASNPLQTAAGGQAATLSAQNVTNNVTAVMPVYVSSVVENATPARIDLTYNLTLANIVPATSAFNVRVNSVVRTVSSVTVSGTKVLLTLSSPIVFGDIVTVAYTKPASNPLQTAAGGQAATLSAQNVTNNVTAVMPVYVSSVVENATPARIDLTYNLTLANIVPATSAFNVRVNSVVRTVSSVTVSGTKVLLTLSSPIVFGDIVTVAYTKPASNPLQTAAGGQAATLSAQNVTNNCTNQSLPVNLLPIVTISSPAKNNSFTAPATIVIEANASDSDGRIIKVEFYDGNIKLGERSTIPYQFTWKDVPPGEYQILASAVDNSNGISVSSPVSVIVTPPSINQLPVISITSPLNGSNFTSPAVLNITVDSYDPDGNIVKVEYFNGSFKIGESSTAPFTLSLNYSDTGSFSITAIATDNLNARTTSNPVAFIISATHDSQSEYINLFPNPNDGHFSIEFNHPQLEKNCMITITNHKGSIVHKELLQETSLIKEFDLSYVKPGIYILMISGEKILITKKLIIR